MIQDGQVVLFTFPQTDQELGKLRPALVMRQLPGGHDDWLVCMISTRIRQHVSGLDEVIQEIDPAFSAMGLKKPSVIRVARLAVVAGEILHGSIGQLSAIRLQSICTRLANWIQGASLP
jgi:mRNA interferase MazF